MTYSLSILEDEYQSITSACEIDLSFSVAAIAVVLVRITIFIGESVRLFFAVGDDSIG